MAITKMSDSAIDNGSKYISFLAGNGPIFQRWALAGTYAYPSNTTPQFQGRISLDSNENIYTSASNYYFSKFDKNGYDQTSLYFSNTAADYYANYGTRDSSGNIYITGWSSLASTNDLWVIKLDSSYNITWKKSYNPSTTTPKELRGQNITVDASGNVYVVGLAYSTGGNTNEGFVAKINSSGTMQWIKRIYSSTYATNTGAPIYALDVDSSGNVYVASRYPYGSNPGQNSLSIIKLSSTGSISWQKNIATSAGGDIYAIKCSSDGTNIYAAGSYFVSGRDEEAALFKIAMSNGTVVWTRILNSTGYETHDAIQIAEDSSGNIYLKGRTQTPSLLITKYNSSGTLQWQREITPLSIGGTGGIDVINNNVYIACGNQVMVKIPTDGSGTGTFTFNGQTRTYQAGTRTDSSGITTLSNSSWTASDISYTTSDITGSLISTSFTEVLGGI
jgi:hypothetical protein